MKEKFTSGQRKTLLLCFLCYSAAYTGRLNLSAALPGLRDGMALTAAQAGMFQTVFALIYAVGQIVNGARADRASIRRSIGTGLILSAVCNVLLAASDNYVLMMALWALNGAAQTDSEARVHVVSRRTARARVVHPVDHGHLRPLCGVGGVRRAGLSI